MTKLFSGSVISYGSTLPAGDQADGVLFHLTDTFTDPFGAVYAPGLYMYGFDLDVFPLAGGDQVGRGWTSVSSNGEFVSKAGDIMSGPLRVNGGIRAGQGTPAEEGADIQPSSGFTFGDDGDTGLFSTGTTGLGTDVALFLNGVKRFTVSAAGAFINGTDKVWHAGNDGAGSGLDADLLDGKDASYFENLSTGGPVDINSGTTGTLGVGRGGTGANLSPGAGSLIYAVSSTELGATLQGTAGQVLQSNGTSPPSFINQSALKAGSALKIHRNANPAEVAMTFNFNQDSVPTPQWLWGTYDGDQVYVYSPSNLTVSHAATAGSIAWSNVSGRPTAVSAFTNDAGYATSAALAGYVAKSGDTMTGALQVGASSLGHVALSSGNATNSGIIAFFADSGVRQGYIGWSPTDTTADGGTIQYQAGLHSFGGSISATGEVTAYASDARLKKNVTVIKDAVEKVKSLGGYEYDWDLDKTRRLGFKPSNEHEHGLLAQEVQKVMPDAVAKAPFNEEYLTVKYERIVALLTAAINEQQLQIEQLKETVDTLRERVDTNHFAFRNYGF